MGVDESKRRRDRYEARLGEDDQRVEVAGWVYYVRAVKWDRDLTHGLAQPSGALLIDGTRYAAHGLRSLLAGRRPWIIGVVRLGAVSTWNDLEPRVVHRETLGQGDAPRPRIEDLAEQVTTGTFAPET